MTFAGFEFSVLCGWRLDAVGCTESRDELGRVRMACLWISASRMDMDLHAYVIHCDSMSGSCPTDYQPNTTIKKNLTGALLMSCNEL